MRKCLWLAGALAVLLPAAGHAQSCAESRPNDICESAAAPTAARTAASVTMAATGEKPGSSGDKVSGPIRDVLFRVQQRALGAEAQGGGTGAGDSTAVVRVNPAGEIQVYLELVEFRPEHVVQLEAHGMRVEVALPEFRLVQGWLPAAAVDAVAGLGSVKEVRQPDYGVRNSVGAASTAGDSICVPPRRATRLV